MDWFGKSSKVESKNTIERLGIRFEPTVFHPDRNEYELRIEVSGCQKDLIKLTYDKQLGKLKLQGQKQKAEFVHHFPVPADCLAAGIYGRFRGDVLHIIMPRMLSERPPSGDVSSKQEDDQKASSDQKATEQVGEDREKLPARVPAPPPSDQKSTDEAKEIGGKDRNRLPASVPVPPPSDQQSTDGVKDIGGKDRGKLPARVPPPPPSDRETTEKSRQRDNELFPEISAPPRFGRESSRSVKELREKYQKNISKIVAPPPSPPPRAAASAPSNRETTEIRARKEEEDDRKPPSDPKEAEQKKVESEQSVVKSQNTGRKSGQEVAKNAILVTELDAKEESKKKRPSVGGNETSGLVAKVKETGKAAVAVAMKEENRLAVMIGAAVLAIVVIGASIRSSTRRTKY